MSDAWSIRRRLPLLLVSVLVVVVATLVGSSYVAVRGQALATVEERLRRIVAQVPAGVDPVAVQRQLARLTAAAGDPAVVAVVAGMPTDSEAARAVLRSAAGEGADTLLVGLWSGAGALLLETGRQGHGRLAGSAPSVGENAAIGRLVAVDDTTVFYDVAAPVRWGGGPAGALAVRRIIAGGSSEALRAVIGSSGALLLGNADGSLWIEGAHVVAPPSTTDIATNRLVSFERAGIEYVGVGTSVAPSPWVALVEMERAEALAPASAFLGGILSIAAGLLALGAFAGWVLGRRLTAPLGELERAVTDLSAGNYSTRVSLTAPAEVAHLGSAMNSMAEQIQTRSRELALATDELRLERAKMVAAFDTTSIGLVLTDPKGADMSMNAAALRFHGFRSVEDMHARVEEYADEWELRDQDGNLMPFDQWPLPRAIRGDYVRDHDVHLRNVRTGYEWVCSYTAAPVRNGTGEVVRLVLTLLDITERKRAEAAIRGHEERYHQLFNTLLEGFCIIEVLFDADDRPIDYRFLEINSAFERQTGLHDAQGKRMLELAPDHEKHWFEMYGRIALTGQPVRFVNEAKALNRWYDVSAYRMGGPESRKVAILFNDISDIKRGEARIQSQLEHLRLLDHITRSIGERQDLPSILQAVVVSLEESLPVDFACVFLYEPSTNALRVSAVGSSIDQLARDLSDGQGTIGVDDNGLGRCVRGELVYEPDVTGSGLPLPSRLAAAGIRSLVLAPLRSESRVFGVLAAARRRPSAFESADCELLRQVSEHVALASHQAQLYGALQQAYDDLRQTQQTMMQEERLRALGQMASGIAHDINNALSPVSLYAESMLETESALSDRGRRYLEAISLAVSDVAETVARMREFYRPREAQLTLKPVQMNDLVHQILDLTRARWFDMPQQRGIVIEAVADLEPDLPDIMGVESEIRDALTNLVFNAIDALPTGGTLTLRTRLRGRGTDAAAVTVEVDDTGVGMDEETRRRCLEPFFTTKGERGTGLGLAMVFGMVQRHSAEIELESAVGRGTTVRLSFAVAASVVADGAGAVTAPRAPSRLRILLVDDDPVLLKSLCDTLETDGHVVATAHGGETGIAAFRQSLGRDEAFAAVITDLGMPHVDGRQVAEAVKASSPSTPVILLTGWGRRLQAENDVPPFVDRVLAKPPKLREVRDALAQLCRVG